MHVKMSHYARFKKCYSKQITNYTGQHLKKKKVHIVNGKFKWAFSYTSDAALNMLLGED